MDFPDKRTGLFIFTKYCGVGNRIWRIIGNQQQNSTPRANVKTYGVIDECCRVHDSCPNYVAAASDYQQFPGLEMKNQFFSKLQCECDADFYLCLNNLNSFFANMVATGYGAVQPHCFDLQHPIQKCTKHSFNLYGSRCIEYSVDGAKPKQWQWFDVPQYTTNIYNFPVIGN